MFVAMQDQPKGSLAGEPKAVTWEQNGLGPRPISKSLDWSWGGRPARDRVAKLRWDQLVLCFVNDGGASGQLDTKNQRMT
jgi:hypothetical protein